MHNHDYVANPKQIPQLCHEYIASDVRRGPRNTMIPKLETLSAPVLVDTRERATLETRLLVVNSIQCSIAKVSNP